MSYIQKCLELSAYDPPPVLSLRNIRHVHVLTDRHRGRAPPALEIAKGILSSRTPGNGPIPNASPPVVAGLIRNKVALAIIEQRQNYRFTSRGWHRVSFVRLAVIKLGPDDTFEQTARIQRYSWPPGQAPELGCDQARHDFGAYQMKVGCDGRTVEHGWHALARRTRVHWRKRAESHVKPL
ncbi:hypothetical protein GQ53DRAFT_318299 [Thozetella sp. PMI_491]|nr:hypothetical protein GQ53DRAFT_318299 [Thozetella sp. PMI_491]